VLLLLSDKLDSINESVALVWSLELMLSSLSLQIDNDSVSVLCLTEFTFHFDVKIKHFKLIKEAVNFCDVFWLWSFIILYTKWYSYLMCTSVFIFELRQLIFSEHLNLCDLVFNSLSELNCLKPFLSTMQWTF